MPPSSRRSRDLAPDAGRLVWILPLLPLVCVALGGATARWSEGVALVLVGGLLAACPPRAGAGRGMHAVLGGFLLLAVAAFLPEAWFPAAGWRTGLEDDLAAPLGWTHSPQPWLTAENLALFLAGIGWFYLNWTQGWNGRDARRAAAVFAGGVGVLAAVFIGLRLAHVAVPIWPTERRFGPFPNRNQTADFLAVGSLLILGCSRLEWRAGRLGRALAWGLAWMLAAWGVFLSYSRAGIGILFLGTAIYLGLEVARSWRRGARTRAGAIRRVALALTAALGLLSGFLLLGGDALERFRPASAEPGTTVTSDFRLRIQRDAVDLANASPAVGVGLGNFGAVFPFYRARSALPARAIHPESDYLWLAGELGWGAVGLAAVGLGLAARRLWPVAAEPERALRAAAALAAAAFAAHGLLDVSAHRFGTVFSAIFILGLALKPGGRATALPAAGFRAWGVGLAAVGLIWGVAATHLRPAWAGLQGVERLKQEARAAMGRRDFAAATKQIDRALEWAPLDWTLYFARASADLGLGRDVEAVATDFRRARYLESDLAEAPMTEAKLWVLAGQPGLAVNALAEACRREPANTEGYVGQLFAAAHGGDLALRDEMATLARTNPDVELPFYEQIDPPESGRRIDEAIAADPAMRRFESAAQRARFLRIRAQRGDPRQLAAEMRARPEWQALGWRWWADACARSGDFRQAVEIVGRFAPSPKLPPPPVRPRTPEDLLSTSLGSPADPALAVQMYYVRAALPQAAREAVARVAAQKNCPGYFHWLDAQLLSDAGDWERAWRAWESYLAGAAR